MQRTSIIASNITNLTDARYFAAQGVGYLLFDLNDIGVDPILEIIEWVSGPQILLLFSEESANQIDEAALKIKPFAIGAKDKLELSYLSGHFSIFEYKENQSVQITLENDIYETHHDTNTGGIIIQGSDETKVGFKSYDELDEFFDQLN